MKIHPLLTTALATTGVVALSLGVYRAVLEQRDASVRRQLAADMRQLGDALGGAVNTGDAGALEVVLERTGQLTSLFNRLQTGYGAEIDGGLVGAISASIARRGRTNDGALQRAYLVVHAADVEARIRALFSSATTAILAYDVDADLRGITPTHDGRELIRRMYRAKSGLIAARERLAEAPAEGENGFRIVDMTGQMTLLLATIDRIIISTDQGDTQEADSLLVDYRAQMRQLQSEARTLAEVLQRTDSLRVLADDAASLVPQLVEYAR